MKYLLISPREPSGATWLINCLLELGIKTYRRSDPSWMWQKQADGSYKLNPEEIILRKWLPVLAKKESFFFRDDIEVQWTHEWPIKAYRSFPVIYFIRDPRDSMHSRYKREAPLVSFKDFMAIPDVETLLHKIDNWVLFNLYWLQRKDLQIFRFEDYKSDAENTLRSLLNYIRINPTPEDFSRAIAESTADKAKESETVYREVVNTADREIINRSGAVSEWKKLPDETDRKVIDSIERRSEQLLKRFGYELRGLPLSNEAAAFYPNIVSLPFFKRIEFSPKKVLQDADKENTTIKYLSDFVQSINTDWIDNSNVSLSEISILLNSLLVFFTLNPDKDLSDKITLLMKHYNFNTANSNAADSNQSLAGKIKQIIKKIIS